MNIKIQINLNLNRYQFLNLLLVKIMIIYVMKQIFKKILDYLDKRKKIGVLKPKGK